MRGMMLLSDLVRDAVTKLEAAGVPNANLDARLIAAGALGVNREDLLRQPEFLFSPSAVQVFNKNIRRRVDREPVSRIFGQREFRSLEFIIDPSVLDPRPDSEVVVETAVDFAQRSNGSARILDIGTGSGCLLLSILNVLPDAYGVGVDHDNGSVANAASNARRLGFSERSKFIQSVWTEGVNEKFDIIVSNPPYIRTQDIENLAPEVTFYDPPSALDGGPDGLNAYREIARRISTLMFNGSFVVVEIGVSQKESVAGIFNNASFQLREVRKDLGGLDRCLVFSKH